MQEDEHFYFVLFYKDGFVSIMIGKQLVSHTILNASKGKEEVFPPLIYLYNNDLRLRGMHQQA